jgi:hypothetical protein
VNPRTLLVAIALAGCAKHDKPAPPPAATPQRTPSQRTELTTALPGWRRDLVACTNDDCKRAIRARATDVVVHALIEHRIDTSLADVDQAITGWRAGNVTSLAAHGAVLAHATRIERTTDRLVATEQDAPDGILRDAFDAHLLSTEDFVLLAGKQPTEVQPLGSLLTDATPPDKRETINKLLDRGPVLIHLDARREGVVVPAAHAKDADLVLRIGHDLSPPVPDLVVDAHGISATLTFSSKGFHCVIPWAALYGAMHEGDERGTVWAADVPDDIMSAP